MTVIAAVACAAFPAAAMATHSSDAEDDYPNALSANQGCAPAQCGTAQFPLGEAFHIGDTTGYTPVIGADDRKASPAGSSSLNVCGGFSTGVPPGTEHFRT